MILKNVKKILKEIKNKQKLSKNIDIKIKKVYYLSMENIRISLKILIAEISNQQSAISNQQSNHSLINKKYQNNNHNFILIILCQQTLFALQKLINISKLIYHKILNNLSKYKLNIIKKYSHFYNSAVNIKIMFIIQKNY